MVVGRMKDNIILGVLSSVRAGVDNQTSYGVWQIVCRSICDHIPAMELGSEVDGFFRWRSLDMKETS